MKSPLPPDPEEMNESRAEYAGVALDRFADVTGIRGESPSTKLQDLLSDLMHLCDRTEGLDFESCLSMARIHYGDETCDDSDPEGVVVDDEPSPFDDDSGELSPVQWEANHPEAAAFAAAVGVPAVVTRLDEVLAVLAEVIEAAIDTPIADGYEQPPVVMAVREKAMALFAKYDGKGGK